MMIRMSGYSPSSDFGTGYRRLIPFCHQPEGRRCASSLLLSNPEAPNIIVVLIMAKRYGVAYQSQYRRPPVQAQDFPDLRSSSDFAWLAWKPYHDKGVKLNHVFTWSVTNGGTQRLIAAALQMGEMDNALKPYPWIGWSVSSRPGLLLLGRSEQFLCKDCRIDYKLGSPNGIGVGYLLGQSAHPM